MLPPGTPEGVFLLDPGVGTRDEVPKWTPENLPMDRRQTKRYLSDCLRFGEQFASPRELSFFAAGSLDDFYSGSVHSIRSELRNMEDTGTEGMEGQKRRQQAQMMLVLAWSLEEKLLELAELDAKVSEAWIRFDSELGMEDDDRHVRRLARNSGRGHLLAPEIPWQEFVLAYLELVPPGTCLFLSDSKVREAWEESGVDFTALSSRQVTSLPPSWGEDVRSRLTAAEAPGWKLVRGAAAKGPDQSSPKMQQVWSILCWEEPGAPSPRR